MRFTVVNAKEKSYSAQSFLLAFGAYGNTALFCYGEHLEDCLETAVDWLAEHAPGLLADREVAEKYNRLRKENPALSEEEAQEQATVDTTYVDPGHYLHSWEWTIILDNPTPQALARYYHE